MIEEHEKHEERAEHIVQNEQILQRQHKLALLRKSGNPFPNDFRRNYLAMDLCTQFDKCSHEDLDTKALQVAVAGRMMTRRLMGKASFVHLQDVSGKIQLYIRQDALSSGVYDSFQDWDLGDIIGALGILFKTKTGELSIKVTQLRLLTKALRPLPDKWHGLQDQELRYRQRYLDLIVNEHSRSTFIVRSKVVQSIRNFLTARGYLEVETPMMQVIPGGAAAKPFITHHNALSMDLYLRISPELYLKRLVVGGFEKVYEINRNFRNEGLSTRHNPEFTMIEFYEAYADYKDYMNLSEELFKHVVSEVLGTLVVNYQGLTIDFSKPFQRFSIKEAILHYNPDLPLQDLENKAALISRLKTLGVKLENGWGIGRLQLELFDVLVEHQLQNPTFITEFPTEVSPLARANDQDPSITDRAELYIAGREIANLFSELNDAEDQANRFREQVRQHEAGDEEAMHYDADYINALEHGLPPTAGEGIGIDRLVMLLTDSPSIRDVLLFPHMRNV